VRSMLPCTIDQVSTTIDQGFDTAVVSGSRTNRFNAKFINYKLIKTCVKALIIQGKNTRNIFHKHTCTYYETMPNTNHSCVFYAVGQRIWTVVGIEDTRTILDAMQAKRVGIKRDKQYHRHSNVNY